MRALLLSLVLGGCLPKAATVTAEQPVDVAVAALLSSVEDRPVEAAPDAVGEALAVVVAAHNLRPQPADGAALLEKRTTGSRLALLAEGAGSPSLVLLVESEARYYSQLSGRYRWTITVTATVARSDAPGDGLTEQFEVPVFLQFHHEREPEALQAALPVIERRVSGLLDTWLDEAR